MVYANNVNRVTFSGTMWGGAEEWSTGFFLGEESAAADMPTQAMADALMGLWRTFFMAAGTNINVNYLTTQVKVAQIKAIDGRTLEDSVVYGYPSASTPGNTTTGVMPSQNALVITLLSDRPRGKASKGRMYLPGICAVVQATGKIQTTVRDSIATNVKTFFDGVRAHADIPNSPILAAKGTGLFPQLTAQNDYIEKIKVGDVIDTQRRRRNGLTEVYAERTLT